MAEPTKRVINAINLKIKKDLGQELDYSLAKLDEDIEELVFAFHSPINFQSRHFCNFSGTQKIKEYFQKSKNNSFKEAFFWMIFLLSLCQSDQMNTLNLKKKCLKRYAYTN
jgi:3-methyladenine DNA glycosylase AlkD